MKLSYYGHGCYFLEYGAKKFLIDPFISGNPLIDGQIDVHAIRCDYILVTHAHIDHIADLETVAKNNPDAVIVSNYEIATHYGKKDFKHHPLNHGGAWTFDNIRIKYVAAIHTSSFQDGTYGGEPGGFVLMIEGEPTVYFAGDTALTMDMKLIPMTCGPVGVAVFPIGGNFTMDYNDAVIAAEFVQCKNIVGGHYDTFGWIKIDKQDALDVFEAKGVQLHLPDIGGSLSFDV